MVEWKKLGDCLDFEQPTAFLVNSTEYDDSYSIPVLTAGQSLLLGYTNEKDGIYKASKENPCIIFDDFTTSFHWIDYDFKVKSSAMKMLRPKKEVCFRYVYYAMRCVDFVPGGHQRHWISKYSQFEIPYPSLSEQRRIVGILDTFTASIDNLKEQIAQRRKQYEYYLSCFFSTEKWPENKIGELTKVFSCPRVFKDQWQDSGVPFWRSSDIMSYHNGVINPRGEVYISQSLYDELSSKSDKIKEGDILVTGGGSIGIPYLKKDNSPLFVKDADLICIQKCISIIPKYLYHYFLSTDFKLYLKKITHDATIAHYTINQIKDTPIPLPPLKEQQRIVDILDKFEASIQNLEAQLSQREKQYDYYRNKLLTFE